uniref:Uncharacterized protein n=1 Tax=Utricularia reniformis TaxID=192314 RepID=A0A1Y0B1E0_9LAMI|nr:hypothetical protein AEK19_MT1043 [Utricularia reniformis]ART31266.1 hypothetical protein AEK19_MT1043 [Utricularia reniformis]
MCVCRRGRPPAKLEGLLAECLSLIKTPSLTPFFIAVCLVFTYINIAPLSFMESYARRFIFCKIRFDNHTCVGSAGIYYVFPLWIVKLGSSSLLIQFYR